MPKAPPAPNQKAAPRTVAAKAPPTSPSAGTSRKAKTFSITPWNADNEGERIVIYSASGMGKSTLASLALNPIFIGVDPGGRKIRVNGKPLQHIPIESYLDLRDALAQPGLFKKGQTLVIDTLTRVESEWTIPHILNTVTGEKGSVVKYIERYGYGKGWQFVLDHTRLLLNDLDRVAAQGVNIVLLCQESAITVANAEGTDFLQNGPKLTHTRQSSCRLEVSEWADHVLRIGYLDTHVTAGADDRVGKMTSDDTTRVIYTQEARHFVAKSRPLVGRNNLDKLVSFADPTDASLWTLVFG